MYLKPNAETFITHYKGSMKIDISALKAEACVEKDILPEEKKKQISLEVLKVNVQSWTKKNATLVVIPTHIIVEK